MKNKILVIEDDRAISELLCMNLEAAGYETVAAYDGEEAQRLLLWQEDADLAVVDIMLPGKDGFALMEDFKKKKLPVLYLTAKDDVASKVKGLKLGAEDYMVKPFEMLELLVRIEKVLERTGRAKKVLTVRNILVDLVSRINALLRRANSFQAADTELQSNGIKVLLLQRQVFKNGALLDLTAAEYKLLCLFMRNPNMVLTKEQILDKLWDCDGNYIDSSTLTVYMRRLRMKIEDNPSEPQMLLTVRGMGYKWNITG